jgi:16S rRNA (uracil1498-N3)-methyltransferase
LVVQKLTEIGIDDIVLFSSRRSVVQWDSDRVATALSRLRRVVEASVSQCRRPWSPTVSYLPSVTELTTREGVVKADLGGGPLVSGDRTVLVGPEGGWDPGDRLDTVRSVGFAENVLRAETAALIAGFALVIGRGFHG